MSVRLVSTLDSLYAAASGDLPWDDALTQVVSFIGCAAVNLHRVPLDGSPAQHLHSPHDAAVVAEYHRDFMPDLDRMDARWQIFRGIGVGETRADSDVLGDAAMDRLPLYALLGRHGLRYGLVTGLRSDRREVAAVTTEYWRRSGPPPVAARRRQALLAPHLARALRMAEALGAMADQAATLTAALDALPQPAFVVAAPDARVVHHNPAAEALLRRDRTMRVQRSALYVGGPAEQEALLHHLDQAARRGVASPPLTLARDGTRQPIVVTLFPLTGRQPGGRVLVLARDIEEKRPAPITLLRSAFGLTPAEARLTAALADGMTLQDYADTAGVAADTARTHVKRALAKTGSRRQAELIRLALRMSG